MSAEGKREGAGVPALPPSLGGLVLSGCKEHPHRTDLSCCKIRRTDGSPLSVADTWAEIQRLRDALNKIISLGVNMPEDAEEILIAKTALSAPNTEVSHMAATPNHEK